MEFSDVFEMLKGSKEYLPVPEFETIKQDWKR